MQKKLKNSGSETLFWHAARPRCTSLQVLSNAKAGSSVFRYIKVDALGMVVVLSARVKAECIPALGPFWSGLDPGSLPAPDGSMWVGQHCSSFKTKKDAFQSSLQRKNLQSLLGAGYSTGCANQ